MPEDKSQRTKVKKPAPPGHSTCSSSSWRPDCHSRSPVPRRCSWSSAKKTSTPVWRNLPARSWRARCRTGSVRGTFCGITTAPLGGEHGLDVGFDVTNLGVGFYVEVPTVVPLHNRAGVAGSGIEVAPATRTVSLVVCRLDHVFKEEGRFPFRPTVFLPHNEKFLPINTRDRKSYPRLLATRPPEWPGQAKKLARNML